MKTKRILLKMTGVVASVLLIAICGIWQLKPVKAQIEHPPPEPDRISFGIVSITPGQTLRLNVSNTQLPNPEFPPDPCRVVLTFLNSDGNFFRSRDGQIIRRVVMLEPGKSTSLELNADDFGGNSNSRIQLRAVATIHPPPTPDDSGLPPDPCVPTVEVINNANGRTQFAISALPAVQKLSLRTEGE